MHPAEDSRLVALARLILAASRGEEGACAVGSTPAVASPLPASTRTAATTTREDDSPAVRGRPC
jgi:hypothetical protein